MLLVPHFESKGRSEVMPEASASKENGVLSIDSQNKYLKCKTNDEDRNLKMDRYIAEPPVACTSSDVDVNSAEFANIRGNGLVKAEGEEETESSSSFGDSDSGVENPVSDSEGGSHLHGDSTSDLAINGFGDLFRMRRKKLTSQWRTFIQPLMWRCKWLELQIKKCNDQALKYDRDLAAYNQKKCFQSENFNKEGFCVRSLPFSSDIRRDKVMCRKKRRKIEDTEDMVSYMSIHNLFSYEGKDNRVASGIRMDEDLGIQEKISGDNEPEVDDRLWLQGDRSVLLEGMLRKIGLLESKVSNLKSRMNKVMSENAEKLHLGDDLGLLVPSNGLYSPVQSLGSPPTSRDRIPVRSPNIASELPSQYDMGSVGMPEHAASSNADVSYLPGVVGSAAQPNLQGKCMNVEDKVLIYNDRLKEEVNNSEEAKVQPNEKPQVSTQGTSPPVLDEPELPPDGQPAPKLRSISKLTAPEGRKKRGKRRASSSRWNRRLSS